MGQSEQTSSVRCGQPDRAFPSAVSAPGCPRNMASHPNLVRITQRRTYKAPALRLERDLMLAPRQHHPTERDRFQFSNVYPINTKASPTNTPFRTSELGRSDVPHSIHLFCTDRRTTTS